MVYAAFARIFLLLAMGVTRKRQDELGAKRSVGINRYKQGKKKHQRCCSIAKLLIWFPIRKNQPWKKRGAAATLKKSCSVCRVRLKLSERETKLDPSLRCVLLMLHGQLSRAGVLLFQPPLRNRPRHDLALKPFPLSDCLDQNCCIH